MSSSPSPGEKRNKLSSKILLLLKSKKATFALISVIAVLASLALLSFIVNHEYKKTTTEVCSTIEEESLLVKSLEALKPLDHMNAERLKPVAKEIESTEGYNKDPNCMYVLTIYYTELNNLEKSQESYNRMEKLLGDDGILSDQFNLMYSAEDLKQRVEFVEISNQELQDNTQFIGEPSTKEDAG